MTPYIHTSLLLVVERNKEDGVRAFTGATLARFLANGRAKLSFNILMALLLACCAVSIAMH
ncbi:MAG: hypothetical protein ACOYM2_18170 [Rectinemataceae bacterium]